MTNEAILFDMDGVIASSEIQKVEAHVQTVLDLGGTDSPALHTLYGEIIGHSFERTSNRFLDCAGLPSTPDFQQAYLERYSAIYRSMIDKVQLTPGAKALLQALVSRQYRLGLVSSAHGDEVTALLRRHQITPFFTVVITREDVTVHKPAPEPYLKALARLDLAQHTELAVVFEDTWAGITAARAAGLTVFAMRHALNAGQDFSGAADVFDALADARILPTIEATFQHSRGIEPC